MKTASNHMQHPENNSTSRLASLNTKFIKTITDMDNLSTPFYQVLIDACTDNEQLHCARQTFMEAVDVVVTLNKAGTPADIIRVNADGSRTFDF